VFVQISAVERAGLSTLNEGAKVSYEEMESRGKTAAENLNVSYKCPSPGGPPLRTGGFSFAVRGRGKLLTVPFKSMLLGAADAPDEAS